MFLTCQLQDSVRILPCNLGEETFEAVNSVLEASYLDRVVPDCGLVVSIFEVSRVEGGFIYHSEGIVHFTVDFTVAVFRPLLGELLVGKLRKASREGLWISLGFFEDVFVPEYCLQQPSHYHEEEKVWYWDWEGNKMYMDMGTDVRFRVKDVKLNPVPTVKQLRARGEELLGTTAQPFVPMEVIGAMNSDGLGCIEWWTPSEEDEMAE